MMGIAISIEMVLVRHQGGRVGHIGNKFLLFYNGMWNHSLKMPRVNRTVVLPIMFIMMVCIYFVQLLYLGH